WLTDALTLYESLLLEFLKDFENAVAVVASQRHIRDLTEQHSMGLLDQRNLQQRCQALLLAQANDTAGVLAIVIADPQGRVIAASDDRYLSRDLGEHPEVRKGVSAPQIGEPLLLDRKYQALATGPIRSTKGTVTGVAIAVFDWTALVRVLMSPQRFGASGRVVIAARRGAAIDVLVPGTDGRLTDQVPPSASSVTGRAVLGERGFQETVDQEGREVLAAFQPVGRTHWGLVVKADSREVYRHVWRLKWTLVGSTLALLLLGVVLAHILARRIANPIARLTEQAERLSQGELSARVEPETHDEIGALAMCFNRMAETIADSHATLEEKVESRTRDLEKALAERTAAEQSLRRSQEQLQTAAKMEAVGTLSAGVAHHFSNMLQVLLGHAEALESAIPGEHLHRRSLDTIFRVAERASDLVRRLLRFSGRRADESLVVDVNAVVVETADMLHSFLPETVKFEVLTEPSPALVKANPRELEEVLVNLTINARDAMPAGGRLCVQVSGTTRAGVECVDISVSDSGCGMDAEAQRRLFEPFYTTKGPESGTGLGLAIVYGIVQRHSGSVTVASELGRGTCIRVALPRLIADKGGAGASTLTDDLPRPPIETLDREATILVVEDHEDLRDVLAQRLIDHGYHAIEASTAEQALSIAGAWADPIQLLITDVTLPGRSGFDLASTLRGSRPDLAVIYMTGHSRQVDALAPEDDCQLQLVKPFRLSELLGAIRRLLNRRPRSG
ncbi:MAG: response regulator, partial [Candidatus Riflebacteria bacterium]|nr:response regulator [Candidatus Riflebacteria bacterium]